MEFLEDVPVVTLDTAKQLKTDGFNEPTNFYYIYENSYEGGSGKVVLRCGKGRYNYNSKSGEVYSAPSRTELKDWKG
jgi:hypothetical protein